MEESGPNATCASFYIPPGSNDPGWKYAFLVSKSDANSVTCRLCGKVVKGGINRMKQHLAHIKGNVAACRNSDLEIQREIKEYIERGAKKRAESSASIQDLRDEITIKSSNDVSDTQAGHKKQKTSESVEVDAGSIGLRQSTIKDAFKKEERARVNKYMARYFYDCNIPFNVVRHPSFIRICEAIGQYGPGYKPPSYHEISETLLRDEVKDTNDYLESHRTAWKENGCSIMTDAWTDMRGRSIMNLCVNCELGTAFLKSVDASSDSHTAEYIFKLVDQCVEQVGPDYVIQIVTDNASANMAAGRLLRNKYPRIYWSSCAAHCIDLMLEEISKEKQVSSAISKAKTLTTFIYSHSKTLSMMRQFTMKRDIVRPGQTRFATSFLTLQSVLDKKDKLRMMFSSDEWRACKWRTTRAGEKAASIVYNGIWWDQVAMTLKIFSPLVRLLRIVDGERKPSMGFVYGGLQDAKKELMVMCKEDPSQYKPFIDAIESKSKGRLDSPLHLASYYLNPYYFYRDAAFIRTNNAVTSGFLEAMDVFYPDMDIQDEITRFELNLYKKQEGSFGRPLAIRQRNVNDDAFDPGDWWSLHGMSAPRLMNMAIKILKLTSSSSGCERNWSDFEAVHTKKRNKLELKKMNDLVFVKFNSKLRQRKLKKKDPLSTKDRSLVNEWISGEEEVFPGSGLTWELVGEASGANELGKERRSGRLALTVVDEDVEDDEEDSDEDIQDVPDLGDDTTDSE